MKKLISALAAAMLITASLASCGSTDDDSPDKPVQTETALKSDTSADVTVNTAADTEPEISEITANVPSAMSENHEKLIGEWQLDSESGQTMLEGLLKTTSAENAGIAGDLADSLKLRFDEDGTLYMDVEIDAADFFRIEDGKFMMGGYSLDYTYSDGKLTILDPTGSEAMYFKKIGSSSSPYGFYTLPAQLYSVPDNMTLTILFEENGRTTLYENYEGAYIYDSSSDRVTVNISADESSGSKMPEFSVSFDDEKLVLSDGTSGGVLSFEHIYQKEKLS